MEELDILGPFFRRLEGFSALRWTGRVTKSVGYLVESEGPFCSVGEGCAILTEDGKTFSGEIVGFRGRTVLSMPLERPSGIRYGDRIVSRGTHPSLRVGPEVLGRVIDGSGKPLDDKPNYRARDYWPLHGDPPLPLERAPIREPLSCGIRAIDGLLTCGRGQRVGIFGGSGVGKSTLIGMMTRATAAELTVLALVGERGREVREFLDEAIGSQGLARSVIVVSTSDQSPLLRIRAALAATTLAEYFSSRGKNVLLVVDSLTRFAMAQREIGLAAGEPPTAKGYTPSVFTLLARLIERAGNFGTGSITAFYTVLMEGDDQQDPLVDAVRALLDGHLILDRRLHSQGHYPPISVLDSLSRLMPAVCSPEHLEKARRLRQLLAAYSASEDLIRVGAYQKGADALLDRAIAALPAITSFLQQKKNDAAPLPQTLQSLLALPG
ncbi:MAG: FliI/YscN family ATPase [Candidatus Acidiferrum sp.]